MRVRVISLRRSVARRLAFEERNGHLDYAFVDAVDGRALPESVRADPALFAADLRYGPGARGLALSHLGLWQQAAAGDEALTVAEDDAIFRRDFSDRADAVLAALPPGWDLAVWGWNFDSILSVAEMPGVSPVGLIFDEARLRGAIPAFQAMTVPPRGLRLAACLGTPAYTVSPRGAAKLIARCFPLRRESVALPIVDMEIENVGIDVAMSAAYPEIAAYAAFPPLVVTENDKSGSTVQGGA